MNNMDTEDLLELLEEAREQVDKKFRRGNSQVSMLYNMLTENPEQWCRWYNAHLLLFALREEQE